MDKALAELIADPEARMRAFQVAVPEAERAGMGARFYAPVELRAAGGDGSIDIGGHAAVFDLLSDDLGGFRERIARGAFRKALDGDTVALFNHDMSRVLGRTTAGTLQLAEDPRGLAYDAQAAPTTYAQDLRLLIERGDVRQSSFGFTVADDEWLIDSDGNITRTVLAVERLYDVSPVTMPAYPQTDTGLRALARHAGVRPEDLARLMRAGAAASTTPGEELAPAGTADPDERGAGGTAELPPDGHLAVAEARMRIARLRLAGL